MSDETVGKIVIDRIRELGGDGLVAFNRDCGCRLNHIAPCECIGIACEVARTFRCDHCSYLTYIPMSDCSETISCSFCEKPITYVDKL